MTMPDVVVDPARRYAAEVRTCLGDLSEADLGELADDLDDHLAEVAEELRAQAAGEAASSDADALWELLVARLGTPESYAAELRQAAGLPPGSGRQVEQVPVARTVLAWCLLAVTFSALPVLLVGWSVGVGVEVTLLTVGVFVAFMTMLGVVMRRVPRWPDVVAAARGVTATSPPPGTATPAVVRVVTWWLRLLAGGTVLWVLVFRSDAVANVFLVLPWVGTVAIVGVALGVPPWRAAYTEAVLAFPDVVRLHRLADLCRSRRVGRVTLDYLASLRPAWWLVRAWAALTLVGYLVGLPGGPLGPRVALVPLLLAACVVSVWLGIKNRSNAGWNALTVPGNVLAAVVVLSELAG